jgi:hypothetical protein
LEPSALIWDHVRTDLSAVHKHDLVSVRTFNFEQTFQNVEILDVSETHADFLLDLSHCGNSCVLTKLDTAADQPMEGWRRGGRGSG